MVWSWMIRLKREQKLKLLHELLMRNCCMLYEKGNLINEKWKLLSLDITGILAIYFPIFRAAVHQ